MAEFVLRLARRLLGIGDDEDLRGTNTVECQRLLVVEASADICERAQVWLRDEPVRVLACQRGELALSIATDQKPDLILLDVDLPDIDGFEVCRRLKADAKTADIPIVFITGASSTEEKLRGLEIGATDYVTKPFDPAELRARVRSALQTKRLMGLLAQKALTLQESEERFRVLAENSSDLISRQQADGVYLYVSPAAATVVGYTASQLIGQSVFDFVHPDDVVSLRSHMTTVRPHDTVGRVTYRFRRSDGVYVWLESTYRTLRVEGGTTVREYHASARDVSVRKQLEHREQVRADVLEMIAQDEPLYDILCRLTKAVEAEEPHSAVAGIIVFADRLHHCAPNLPQSLASLIEKQLFSFISRFGSSVNSVQTERILFCDLLTDPTWQDLRPSIVAHGFTSCWAIQVGSRHRDESGVFIVYRRDHSPPVGPTAEMLKLASDLTGFAVGHHQLTDALTFQAQHDAMTHLPNRALFGDRIAMALRLSRRWEKPVGVMLIDIDRFKYINDTYGHQAGDEMICQAALRLSEHLRSSDILARMGGDEFAIILNDLAKPDDVHLVAKSLIEAFKEPITLQCRKQYVTVSIGSAVFPRDASDSTSLLKSADLALYRAKDRGRDCAVAFSPEMGEGSVERMELESSLRQALANNEMRLVYQPKVDASGTIVGLEALARWQHPTLGNVPPGKFIPIAEDTGVIVAIGTWVMQEAARQTREWLAAGLPLVPVAVNVSTMQFSQADFISIVADTLANSGIAGNWLEIELTESLLMGNTRDAMDKLAQLRDMKVHIAIDDFGTGYSSLSYLQRLPLDTLKVDRSFVMTIEDENPSAESEPATHKTSGRIITRAIVALAKSLGLSVVAEGVETETQRKFLIEIGCDELQGYLFSPPKESAKIEALMREQLNKLPSIAA